MITSLKSKMDYLLKNRGTDGAVKNDQRFKYFLLVLFACLYISVFTVSSEFPLGDMDIEKKKERSAEYFDHIPVANGSAYGFIGEKGDVVLVPVVE